MPTIYPAQKSDTPDLFELASEGLSLADMLSETITQAIAYQRSLLEVLETSVTDELRPRLTRVKRERPF